MLNQTDTPRAIYERNLRFDWEKRLAVWHNSHELFLHDHLGGFDSSFKNEMIGKIPSGCTVRTEYLLNSAIKSNYPDLNLQFDAKMMILNNHFKIFVNRVSPKTAHIENFLCSFIRSEYVGRVWLACWLHELGWLNFDYSSKHFIIEYYPDEIKELYNTKISTDFDDAEKVRCRQHMMSLTQYFGTGDTGDKHDINLSLISDSIQKSFVCLVAETHPTHYYPFPTEKFLYPIVNSTLWVAYAQPGYHKFIHEYLGFRLYDCFDYAFDEEHNHTTRLAAITDMLQKFSTMTDRQWTEVYQSQAEIIDYNAKHVRTGGFIKHLLQFDEVDQKK